MTEARESHYYRCSSLGGQPEAPPGARTNAKAETTPRPCMSVQQDGCYQWSCDFAVAHAVFACGFITAPVAVLHLVRAPRSAHAIFFAVVSAFFTAVSLVLCFRFYASLKRPPWPLRRAREVWRRHDEQQLAVVMVAGVEEVQAALAAGRIPSYVHCDGDGGVECAVYLGEVEVGEAVVRRLPVCRHVFHAACIDRWLWANATCPVCRYTALPPPPEVVLTINS